MALDKAAAIRATPLFGGLADADVQAVAERAIEQKLSKGEMLFIAGDRPRGLYVVAEGAIRAFRVGPDGREQIIHIERAPATVGEVPLFDEGLYPSNTAAEEDSRILFIAREEINRLLIDKPRIAISALKVLARRVRNCASLVETLSLHDVDRRLARLLLTEARSRGQQAGRGMEVDFPYTHQQVASRIGSVREVVSRAFSRLQQAGLVKVEGKRVVIADQKRFTEYVEGA